MDGALDFLRRGYTFWRDMASGQAGYPIFRQELSYWDARLGGRWRLDELFGLLILANLCLLPVALLIFPWALLLYALLDEVLGWGIAIPAAALIVREKENWTWDPLRVTPFTSLELTVGKLAGLLYLMWDGASYLAGTRWLGTFLALPLLALSLTLPNPFPLAASRPVGLTVVGLLGAYLLFLHRPQLNLIYGASVGLWISTVARSTSEALIFVITAFGSISLASAGLVFWVYKTGAMAALFSESVMAGQLEHIFVWLSPLAIVMLARLVLALACFALATRRIERGSD